MPTSSGPNIAGESNLVFKYDTGDIRNSYKGKPTTNLLTGIGKSGTNDGTYFKTNSGTEVKYVPNVGVRTIHYVNIFNDYYGGSGICCPAPMSFGDFTVSPSTQYTYQIIYRTTTRYANANYMYHYEYNTGTYVTEYGLWSSSRETDLGGGWKHAWGTFTSNASTNRFVTYLFHYEYGVWNKIEVAGIMLTQGNNIIPPTQFLDVGTTRSATQGLLPLVGNSSLDLSNVSFDSNAQIVFDATNDRIVPSPASDFGITNQFTIEVLCRPTSEVNGMFNFLGPNGSDRGIMAHWPWSSDYGYFDLTNTSGGFFRWYKAGAGILNVKALYQFRLDTSGNVTVRQNGQIMMPTGTDVFTGNVSLGTSTTIGAFTTSGGTAWGGDMYVFKVYNRALTEGEMRQNYLHYKTRFNLS